MATTVSNPPPSSGATLPQQKFAHLPNPFDLIDTQILDKVYLTHVNDDQKCDTDFLYNLVSNIITGSTPSATAALTGAESRISGTSFKPEFSILKLISCQMITTRDAAACAHQTTLWILQHLRSYSWDAKALIALAAFSLEYGNFLHLRNIPASDQIGTSLRQLNQVQTRKVPAEITDLALFTVQVLQQIKEWASWYAEGYDTEEVPSLAEAFQLIPLVVYWTINSLVASTGNLVGVSTYTLSDFEKKLSPFVNKLKEHLAEFRVERDRIQDYLRRKRVFANPKDIVDLLKALINRNGSQNPIIYDGSTQKTTDIDQAFRQKYVLLFISSLVRIEDELLLLNSIYDRLQDNPKEVIKGYKKEDFKILWVPIVDEWDDVSKVHFNIYKDRVKFYVVEYFFRLPGMKVIQEDLKFESRPIIPVFNSQGIRINNDAMDLIFEWGIDAFPFRDIDGGLLVQKWKWFWDVMKKLNPGIQVGRDRYLFIYGGNDKKWIQDFSMAVDKIKRHDTIKRADAIIEHFQLGKDNPDIVPRFWIGIESKKPKKHNGTTDCEIQEIVNNMLCLKRDPQGWVILSKGSNIKVLGHGDPMYQTVADFEIWKDKVLQKEGFDIAFKEYYDIKLKEFSAQQPCEFVNVEDDYASNVIATITCPNPTCGRVMEVTSVKYKCCHGNGGKIV